MFSVDERVDFLREALTDMDNVEVDVFKELVVEFARKWDAKVIVKGLRVISDFEWEFQMNQLNRTLGAGHRDRLRDGQPRGELRLVQWDQGDRDLRRQDRPGSSRRRSRSGSEMYGDGRPGAPVPPSE